MWTPALLCSFFIMEERRAIKGYEWLYEISSYWRCRSLPRKVKATLYWKRTVQNYKWQILKEHLMKWERVRYTLSKNNKLRFFQSHRLVAQAFLWLDIRDKKTVVMHLDDDPKNNKVDNLKVWTQKENIAMCIKQWKHYSQTERWLKNLRVQHEKQRKIPISEYDTIREMLDQWMSCKQISMRYTVDDSTMCKIKNKMWYKYPYWLKFYPKWVNKYSIQTVISEWYSAQGAINDWIPKYVYYELRKKVKLFIAWQN